MAEHDGRVNLVNCVETDLLHHAANLMPGDLLPDAYTTLSSGHPPVDREASFKN